MSRGEIARILTVNVHKLAKSSFKHDVAIFNSFDEVELSTLPEWYRRFFLINAIPVCVVRTEKMLDLNKVGEHT